ncbi:hypothetical protein [Arthrobacter sp. NIO-1057]|uniref:hypothetical protein n=1 Tax=Arthrobacter sp. NIO-1057 TaxID=993071 RepID=UPI00071E380B|nr:hypothetical protein [Arthrobacter sp. NIO-1057]KSU65959.1 hypothetical protein AS038_09730 [Arthrobacter sp. NIO-1057]SCC28544.1 hypothetical protein GA0061084_1980 [Arthrobacter sp. NIO-1057]
MNSRKATAPATESDVQGRDAAAGSVAFGGLYAGIAGLGVAALAAASCASLASTFGIGSAPAPWWAWLGAIASAVWAGMTLVYAVASLLKAAAPAVNLAVPCLALVSSVHLASIAAGLWGFPEGAKNLDLTIASLLLLELSVLAVFMWQRKRRKNFPHRAVRSSSLVVLGSMLASSVAVAAVASLGLAASSAGELAVPHSEHGIHHSGDIDPGIIQKMKQAEHHH